VVERLHLRDNRFKPRFSLFLACYCELALWTFPFPAE
jgi:hypothetical protein